MTLTPAPGLVYRTTGGLLDIYFFMGPQPEAVVSQYTEAVGMKEFDCISIYHFEIIVRKILPASLLVPGFSFVQMGL